MKRNKVLLGLYVGLLTLAGGVANAQTGGRFYEIGPDNVGGQVSSIVVDRQDTTRNTFYAGATTGGLFLKSSSHDYLAAFYGNLLSDEAQIAQMADDTTIWHYVPCRVGGSEVSLPINSMIQGPDNTIYIGTGNDDYAFGSIYDKMSVPGSGIYRFNTANASFELIPNTANDNFKAVHALEYLYSDGVLYLFAATNNGLYRWRHVDGADDWNQTPTAVFNGKVDQLVISRNHRTAFFSSGNQLYRIGDVTLSSSQISANVINISSTNPAFGGSNSCIKLAISQSDTAYLYAMVIKANGLMEALYVTNNEQTWSTITTSSIMPITYTSGKTSGAIAVDPQNPRRVVIAGTIALVGEGFVEGGYYQWTTVSASEFDLNGGDYMSHVYNNSSFIHSGIHQIVPVYRIGDDGEDYHTYYFATDGGIYSGDYLDEYGFLGFTNENRGLNNLQINSVAVCPDGSILTGANNNACPIIETHLDHNVSDSSYSEHNISWYHDGSLVLNHEANVLWTGNGGAVAASAFQQVNPLSRRTIFTSSADGNIGRSYADYLNYTNTTTWTIGKNLLSDQIVGGPALGSIYLWETDNNTVFNDSVRVALDTLGIIFRPNTNGGYDTILLAPKGKDFAGIVVRDEEGRPVDTVAYPGAVGRAGSFRVLPGDMTYFNSRANGDYPFQHIFTSAQLASQPLIVQNPLQVRMLAIGDQKALGMSSVSYVTAVWLSWTATDFTKVYDESEWGSGNFESQSIWCPIYAVNRNADQSQYCFPRSAVMSRDGRFVYVNVFDTAAHKSMLVRISNLENMDFSMNLTDKDISDATMVGVSSSPLRVDTIRYNNSVWFPRPISNIAVDPRDGQDRLILTFEDYSSDFANVAIVNTPGTNVSIEEVALADANMPAYCALVEDSTGNIYVGTANGVYVKKSILPWQSYSNLSGVPVTSMCQQTRSLPVRHNITHTGITENKFAFAKTKWPRAIYFGTYGRGVFMDMEYVTDFSNEVVDPEDYTPTVDIPTVHTVGYNKLNLYPNPVTTEAHLALNAAVAGNAVLCVYDINGRLVMNNSLGYVAEGEHTFTLDTQNLTKGMYLINVTIAGHTATAKMMVR